MHALQNDIHRSLSDLNAELRSNGDAARVRFVSIESDPDFQGELLVLVTWELPDPDAPETGWPLEELDRYCELVAHRLDELAMSTECLFRTGSELGADTPLGTRVPEPV